MGAISIGSRRGIAGCCCCADISGLDTSALFVEGPLLYCEIRRFTLCSFQEAHRGIVAARRVAVVKADWCAGI